MSGALATAHTCPTCGYIVRSVSPTLRWPEHRGATLSAGSGLVWRMLALSPALDKLTVQSLSRPHAEPEMVSASEIRSLLASYPHVWRIIERVDA